MPKHRGEIVENHQATPTGEQRTYREMIAGGNIPQEAVQILDMLPAGIQEALGNNFVGLYLRGSIAMGEFDPATSDIDFFAVTEHPISDSEFASLAALHARLGQLPNPYGNHLEGPYIHRSAARRFQPGQRHPTIARTEALGWAEHRDNWILERWTMREHGITLQGPDPRTLIDPISAGELRQAVLTRLKDWADYASDPDDPGWKMHRGEMAYAVETMCRALFSLASGELPGKPQAVAWALETLPEPWRSTVERSQIWRGDGRIDPAIVPEVRRFVLWATSKGRVC